MRRAAVILGVLCLVLPAVSAELEDHVANGRFDLGTWTDLRGGISPLGWSQARGTYMNTTDAKVLLGDFGSGDPPAVRLDEAGGNSALWQEVGTHSGAVVTVKVDFSTDATPAGSGIWGSWQILNLAPTVPAMVAYWSGGWMDDWWQVTQYGTAGTDMHPALHQEVIWDPATSRWVHTSFGPFRSSGKIVVILHASRASQFDNIQVLVEPVGWLFVIR